MTIHKAQVQFTLHTIDIGQTQHLPRARENRHIPQPTVGHHLPNVRFDCLPVARIERLPLRCRIHEVKRAALLCAKNVVNFGRQMTACQVHGAILVEHGRNAFRTENAGDRLHLCGFRVHAIDGQAGEERCAHEARRSRNAPLIGNVGRAELMLGVVSAMEMRVVADAHQWQPSRCAEIVTDIDQSAVVRTAAWHVRRSSGGKINVVRATQRADGPQAFINSVIDEEQIVIGAGNEQRLRSVEWDIETATAKELNGFVTTQSNATITVLRLEEVQCVGDDEEGLRIGEITVDGDDAFCFCFGRLQISLCRDYH